MTLGSGITAAPPVKKGGHMVSWSQQVDFTQEDDLLREQVAVHGSSENWTTMAAQFNGKTGRQCRRRWFTYLNAECKKGGWTPEEDMLLCEAQKIFGNRWTSIAQVVLGRSDNAVKNRFSTLCKREQKMKLCPRKIMDYLWAQAVRGHRWKHQLPSISVMMA